MLRGSRLALISIACMATAGPAMAGPAGPDSLVNIPVAPGGETTLMAKGAFGLDLLILPSTVTDGSPSDLDGKKDGNVRYSLSNETQRAIQSASFCADTQFTGPSFPFANYGTVRKTTAGGITPLEPFFIPLFSESQPTASLVGFFDLDLFVGNSPPLIAGQSVTVINGKIAQVPGLTILIASGLPSDPAGATLALLDDTVISGLSTYTGSARVDSFASFTTVSVPGPPSLVMLISGVSAVIACGHRRERSRAA